MIPVLDNHMHTPLCGHAIGQPEEYVLKGLEVGLEEMGFSDHAPFVHRVDPNVTMSMEQLPEYYQMIESVRDKYASEIVIKVGLEADFLPGYEDKTKAIIDDYPYDYVIGSVHFIRDWEFDNPYKRELWDQKDINQVYRNYFELLRQSALSGMFQIMGHVDLVKKFGHRPDEDMSEEIKKTAAVFKECGVVVEINTSGLRKTVGEMYPSLEHLKVYCEAGVPLTFGSDAHDPNDVGRDYDKAVILAREAGYSEYVSFRNKQIERVLPLP